MFFFSNFLKFYNFYSQVNFVPKLEGERAIMPHS